MWVYQETIQKPTEETASEPALRFSGEAAPVAEAAGPLRLTDRPPRSPQKPEGHTPPREAAAQPRTGTGASRTELAVGRTEPRRRGQATRNCILLTGAYLFGTAMAGVLQALCETKELDMLAYYLDCWKGMFVLDSAGSVVSLFGAQYLSVVGAVTVLLLLGLSAFGPVLIFLFAMLYGAGVGLIGLQLFLQLSWKGFLAYMLVSGLPAAAVAVCLCFFGASALGVSGRLHTAAFGRGEAPRAAGGARLLLGQYLLFDVLLLPICGASTGLVYLVNRLPLG